MKSKWVQTIGFSGCVAANFVLAVAYQDLKPLSYLQNVLPACKPVSELHMIA